MPTAQRGEAETPHTERHSREEAVPNYYACACRDGMRGGAQSFDCPL